MAKLVLILENGLPRGFYSDTPGIDCRVVDLTEGLDLAEVIEANQDVLVQDVTAPAGYSAVAHLYPYIVEEV